ncbi:sortase domain-containing protein [Streptomyces halobius]|uniref:Sortase family protein n=1 Tax=Streptomyces halobius TaxID=2879846 RepID=A0ABY4MFX7_9ACTN|nr:sortase [Streptomyces halobius]UQA95236.1 hypothetical protein K9S39_28310 [Streptomyces halobius]
MTAEEGRAKAPGPGGGRRPGHGHHRPGHGQPLIGVAWAVLLLGLWLWGSGMTGGGAATAPTTGDIAAAGRPPGQRPSHPGHPPGHASPQVRATPSGRASPHAHHAPQAQASTRAHHAVVASSTVKPSRLTISVLGVRAGIVERGRDEHRSGKIPSDGNASQGRVSDTNASDESTSDGNAPHGNGPVVPSPPGAPDLVGWDAAGPQPGAEGVAVLVGRADGGPRRAVFHRLSAVRPGDRVDVRRTDGSTARFTVEDVRIHAREPLDARQLHEAHEPDRSELRLVAWGGGVDRARRAHPAHVVVSAYLTGFRRADAVDAADG